MPDLKVYEITTLSGYAKAISDNGSEMQWFRGVSDATYKLVPSLYRHPSTSTSTDLLTFETDFLARFRERAQPMVDRALPSDQLELLFLMQHYGTPTRLLDWSENAFVALFFALSASRSVSDACVWLLRPISWNKTVQRHISYTGEPFSVGDAVLRNGYMNSGGSAAAQPVCIYGVHNSGRIASQRGVFTLFGTSAVPMEDAFKTDPFEDKTLQKVLIRKASREKMFRELLSAGISDSTVFPDLEGLARELRRRKGYEVR